MPGLPNDDRSQSPDIVVYFGDQPNQRKSKCKAVRSAADKSGW